MVRSRNSEAGDWQEYRKLIIAELERIVVELGRLNAKIDLLYATDLAKIKSEIAVLKFKSGLWGAIAGAVPAVIAIVYMLVIKGGQ